MSGIKVKSTHSENPGQGSRIPARDVTAPYAHLPRPYFARHPEVGYAIALASAVVFIFLTVLVVTKSPLIAWDAPAAQAFYDWAKRQSTPVVLLMRFFSAYGREATGLIAIVLTIVWARRRSRRELWLVVFGLLGSEVWFQAISGLVKRPRPEYKDPFETLIGAGFPSGHAATNVVLGMLVLYLLLPHIKTWRSRVLLIAGVVLVVAMIVVSRLFLGLHYPTDMIAGIFLGLGWGAFIFTFTDRYFWRKR